MVSLFKERAKLKEEVEEMERLKKELSMTQSNLLEIRWSKRRNPWGSAIGVGLSQQTTREDLSVWY